MFFNRCIRSPLAVVVLGVGALSLWTCTYQSVNGPGNAVATAAPPADAISSGAGVPPTNPPSSGSSRAGSQGAGGAVSVSPDSSEARGPVTVGGLRLRHAPVDGELGLPIAIDGGRAGLAHFHAALQRAEAGDGKARILFYGASHVASDSFTGYVRQELQKRFGDAGHGFVLPVHPWRTYRHRGVRIESSREEWEPLRIRDGSMDADFLGLAGVAVESDRRGAWGLVGTADRGSVGRRVAAFEVFYLEQPGGGDFDVLVDGSYRARVSTRRAGRPQPGYANYPVDDGPHTLQVRVRGNGKVRLFGVTLERDQSGVVLDTLGINGARTRSHLLWDDGLYRAHLGRRRPDLVVLAYGTNESADRLPMPVYRQQQRDVLVRIRDTVPDASCLLIGPSDRPVFNEELEAWEDRPRTLEINEVQRQVALDLGCGYFDLLAFQGGPLSMIEWVEKGYGAADHVHLMSPGYRRLAEEVLAALLDGYPPPDAVPPEQ